MPELGTVIVTGGSRGIGTAICLDLAAAGYAVAVNYAREAGKAEAVAAAIRSDGGRALAVAADVADPAQVLSMFEDSVRLLGPLAGLVNNAGIVGDVGRLDERRLDEMRRIFDVNVMGSMLCAQEAIRRMSTRHGGSGGAIVNLSSAAARLGGLAGMVPYAASKGAIESFTRGLANEVAKEGIRVNAVAPGIVATDMASGEAFDVATLTVPMGRAGEPREIAAVVCWLMSPAASFVTGTVITASGGR